MTPASQACPDPAADRRLVAWQLGREPRGVWSVATRCRWGRAAVIEVAPRLADGAPFPTTFWLTCPYLARLVADRESSGAMARENARARADGDLASRMMAADVRYRSRRAGLAGGSDPCAGVGTAGQEDPLAVKCLHARVAAHLAGTGDPVGESTIEALRAERRDTECDDDRCEAATEGPGEPIG